MYHVFVFTVLFSFSSSAIIVLSKPAVVTLANLPRYGFPPQNLGTWHVREILWQVGSDRTRFPRNFKGALERAPIGWHVPSIYELYALYLQKNIVFNDFVGSGYDFFVSSTPVEGDPSCVWIIRFEDGTIVPGHKSNGYQVRFARYL